MTTETPHRSDDDLGLAYARLTGSLRAAPDTTARLVVPGVARRRRRRRATVAAAGLLGVTGVVGTTLALTGGGDRSYVDPATDVPAPTVTMTRTDGSTWTFDDVEVSCEPSGTGHGQRLLVRSPFVSSDGGDSLDEPFLDIEVLVDSIKLGKPYPLPYDSGFGSDADAFVYFVADVDRGGDHNEVSSAQGGATGTVTFETASCQGTPTIDVVVDGALGSEVGQDPIRVSGRLTRP